MALNRENIAGQMPDSGPASGLPWRLFSFILILFFLSLFSYIGLAYGYKPFLERQSAAIEAENKLRDQGLDLDKKKDLVAFYSQIVNVKSLLKNHVFASKIFNFMESTTSKGVAFSTSGLELAQNDLRLDGVAADYDTLVQQLLFWQNHPKVAKVVLQENSTVEGLIRFNVGITFVPDFFTEIDSTIIPASPAQPSVTPPAGNPPATPAGTTTTTTTTTTPPPAGGTAPIRP